MPLLTLTRKLGERVYLACRGEIITVEVVQLRAGQVRLRFDASDVVEILREELVRDNQFAADPVEVLRDLSVRRANGDYDTGEDDEIDVHDA